MLHTLDIQQPSRSVPTVRIQRITRRISLRCLATWRKPPL